MKKEIVPQPYLANMTYDEDCWLIIDCRTGDTPYVSYYNPKQDQDKEYETFKDFAQNYIENEFGGFDNSQIEYKEKTASARGCKVEEDEDYDEESRRSWKIWVPEGQIVKVMTGIKLENIPQEIKKVSKELDDMERDEVSNAKEAAEERKDPYAYRGLSRRDFI
jgi:hypothetical protein